MRTFYKKKRRRVISAPLLFTIIFTSVSFVNNFFFFFSQIYGTIFYILQEKSDDKYEYKPKWKKDILKGKCRDI